MAKLHYNNLDADDSERDVDAADLRCFVVFLNKQFTDDLRFVPENLTCQG